jgi:OOP family OmpA-OmpF porin
MPWRASAVAALAMAGPAAADPPGATRTHAETRALQTLAVPLRPWSPETGPTEGVEGAVEWSAFRLPEGVSALAAAREEEARRGAEGWRTAFFCAAEGCGGFDFRMALDVLPPPAMRLDLFDFAALTMRRGEAILVVLTSGGAGGGWLQRAMATPATPPAVAEPAAEDAQAASAPPTEAAPAPTPPAPVGDAAALLAALDREGRVVLEGVAFAPGSTEPDRASAAALDAAAAALQARPGLSVAVVGHTDGSGDLAVNQRVSAARARAVLEALAARGVSRSRLEAAGAGWLAPRASNADATGQALNRRVELVTR